MSPSKTNRRTANWGLLYLSPASHLRRLVAVAAVLCIGLAFGARGARAANFQFVVVSNALASTTSCVTPSSVSSFSPSDTVYVYFYALNMNAGDQATAHWINPSNQWAWTTTWNPLSGGGNWCFSGSITASQLATSGPWSVQIYINGQQAGQASFSIATQGGGGPPPTNPSYTGSFDAVDCAHAYGWAKDNNNPGATISVDMTIDGTFWATISAGDYRVDLANAGMGNHAWNEYSLPASLHDGNQHRVRVTYSGTSTDLPGSPRTFQNSCGTGPAPSPALAASWSAGSPPSTISSGQSFSVNYQVSGPSQIQSRVCYGTTSSASALCQQQSTAWQNSGPASLTASIGAPLVTGTAPQTIYFVVQAQAGGQTVYSSVAQSLDTGTTIGPPGTPPPSNVPTSTYSSDPNLAGLVVVVQKLFINGNTYQYRFNIVENALASQTSGLPVDIATAHLSVVCPHDQSVLVHRTSFNVQVIYDYGAFSSTPSATQILQAVDAAPWQNESKLLNNLSTLATDAIGFVPYVGTAVGIGTTLEDILKMLGSNPNIGPSTALSSELNDDTYDVYGTDISSGMFGMRAIRFSVNVDLVGGTQPHFFLIVNQPGSPMVGVEIRDNLSVPIIRSN